MKSIKDFWTDDEGFSYVEVIIICGIIAAVLLLTVPAKINQMKIAYKNTDMNHGRIIGKAAENILRTDGTFAGYQVERLSLQEDVSIYSKQDSAFVRAIITELDDFEVEGIPKIKHKKRTYKYFSITVLKGEVYIYMDSGGEDVLQAYPKE